MSKVYGATNTRLERDVALKILPAQLAADKPRMPPRHSQLAKPDRVAGPTLVPKHPAD